MPFPAYFLGNTAQRLRRRYAVRFFGRLCRNFAGILTYVKKFMCKMPENMQVYALQSRQAVFVRCCLYYCNISWQKKQCTKGTSFRQNFSEKLMHFALIKAPSPTVLSHFPAHKVFSQKASVFFALEICRIM